MLSLDATQLAIIGSDYPLVTWLFEVTDAAGPTTYYWSTKAYTFDAQAYDFNIVPESFAGVVMNRSKSELGIQAPNELRFRAANVDNAYTASNFTGGTVLLKEVISDGTDEEIIRSWKFRIKDCASIYQELHFVCEDFLQEHLRGDYPNTRMIKDIFFGTDTDLDDNVCIPLPFGTAYVPLRSVYIGNAITVSDTTIAAVAAADGNHCKFTDSGSGFGSIEPGRFVTVSGFTESENNGVFWVVKASAAEIEVVNGAFDYSDAGLVNEAAGDSVSMVQGSRYYLLGSTTPTYTISKVRSPRAWGIRSEWASGSFSFTQSTKNDGTDNWRVFQAVIADIDNDGTAEANGLWRQGEHFLDMPTKFTRSDTASMTSPADIIEFVLEDMGVDSGDIDTGVGSTFETAETTYTSWGLAWNGALWYKQPREKVLAMLLNMCHSTLIVGEKIELHTLSKTSQKTLTKANIVKSQERGPGTFSRESASYVELSDCGYVAFQEDDEAQDRFLKILVPAKGSTKTKISQEVLELPFIQDSQETQKLGTLYYQRKFLRMGEISFTAKPDCLALQPDDVITINHADYNGSYAVLIDQVTVNRDGSVAIRATETSAALDDWGDLSPSAVSYYTEDTTKCWEPPLSGPLSSESLGLRSYDLWGLPYLIVGPYAGSGQFTSIQAAVRALAESRHNGIYILNGTYALSAPVYLPDRDIDIVGENRDGVVIQNAAGQHGFILYNLTKFVRMMNFKVASQNTSTYTYMIYCYGDAAANNTPDLLIDNLHLSCLDADTHGGNGDRGVYVYKCDGRVRILNSKFYKGKHAVSIDTVKEVSVIGNEIDDPMAYGIYINASGTADRAAIIGENRLSDVRLNGILAGFIESGAGAGAKIVNNVIVSKSACHYNWEGIGASGYNPLVKGNSVIFDGTLGGAGDSVYGISIDLHNFLVEANNVRIEVLETGLTIGLYVGVGGNGVIKGNEIYFENDDTTDYHYGIRLSYSDYNVISGNHINGAHDDAKDIGISLDANCNHNLVTSNFTIYVGTGVEDLEGATNVLADNKNV